MSSRLAEAPKKVGFGAAAGMGGAKLLCSRKGKTLGCARLRVSARGGMILAEDPAADGGIALAATPTSCCAAAFGVSLEPAFGTIPILVGIAGTCG